MQQSEILSFAEQLIPVYHSPDFEYLLSQITDGQPPSVKLLVKMELNRVMAPCSKIIDLRGKVQGECREYDLDGRKHWLDDVAFNAYHKGIKKFGGYTEGVWENLYNTHNNFRVMKQRNDGSKSSSATSASFQVEAITLGYDLQRQENRLKLATQVQITLNDQFLHGISVDLSASGGKFKVPAAFNYKLGQVIQVRFSELEKTLTIPGITETVEYRILAIDDSYDNDAVKFLRTLKLTETTLVENIINEVLASNHQKARHDNQDKIIRARTRGYEHTYLKHTCNLPLFFSGNDLKLVLLTEHNQPTWQYWHDERNQQMLGSVFNRSRMSLLTQPGVADSGNVLYAFKHQHQDKTLFFSMMMPEAHPAHRKLFWHVGAKKESWKAFQLTMFELSNQERQELALHAKELAEHSNQLTHCGILQEIADASAATDYLLVEKPKLAANELNAFRHTRQVVGKPMGIYFDARSRRKEPRYRFRTPLQLKMQKQVIAEGVTVDLSKRGLSIILDKPVALKAGDKVQINYHELKLYDSNLPLDALPYQVIRIGPEGRRLQLMIEENSATMKSIAFFNSIIEHNQDKLLPQKEQLPSPALLEGLHNILLDKMVSSPIFVDKVGVNLRPKVIGVNYPLPPHLTLLAKLGESDHLSLEPIFKGHTNTLLASPMRRIEKAEAHYHEVYIAAVKFADRIQSVESRLLHEFDSLKERVEFIRKGKEMGELYVLRICAAPVFDPFTTLLQSDLNELALINLSQAKNLEKEIGSIVGYGELADITEEVLTRLEIKP
ncbi:MULTISPECIES: PilZ domain-containing protein [Vibrio]|uniref:PilZ domain-containing protein n=1 Tax=Vibrio TaxID=662 RepID=UPI000C171BBD|nr:MULTISPECIES: PilZ domain-containing protein [Vibrio]NAW70527.1 PilZ domain-containing protein [Vibrio sp. V28_P6S34P95]NAX04998.1 PilZ domain-containing protein [Vibrio sp. V30_P3S12P165]NAX33409.1 PilZ domain-containing protein [Vibrio sp. V29_P1S30P107]NAX37722.1 PilZ domain-containing protein [Vibrio sp. V27_P1S3P104]NAX39081.1 PilZ domain-containing protein [Vibrio sp. V26_P1S5P106]